MATLWYFLKNCSYLAAFTFVNLLSLSVFRAFLVEKPDPVEECKSSDSDFVSDQRGLSERLAKALRFRTITHAPKKYETEALSDMLNFISESFPKVHSAPFITKEVVNNLSLLYTVKGTDPSLKPYVLAGHLDVVPVEESEWMEEPFGGKIKDGYIWGRGSIDCKHIVMGVLEALEFSLEKGFQPRRSFYLAFGHDEEGGGHDGAAHISQVLMSRGVKAEYLLDEGTFVFKKAVFGVQVPVAMVGVTEKGSLNLKLEAKSTPGHSSIPPKENAIVILSQALAKLPSTVFPSMLGKGPEHMFFKAVAPYASFPFKMVYSNIWLFKPLMNCDSVIVVCHLKPEHYLVTGVEWTAYGEKESEPSRDREVGITFRKMSSDHIQNAIIRTTAAVTIVSGGLKENVSPSSATAVVNHRIHPAQTVQEAFDYVKSIINDERIQLEVLTSTEPHPLSPFSRMDFGWMTIRNSIHQIFPDCCVAPVTLVANTDTRWYLNLTDAIYRFSPVSIFPHEATRFHGHNERISVENYVQLVNFYFHLIKNSDESQLKSSRRLVDEL